MTDHFTFFESYYNAVEFLEPEIKAEFFDILFKYALRGEHPPDTINPIVQALFTLTKPNLDKSKAKRESGRQGGSKSEANRKQTSSKSEANRKQTSSDKEKEKEKDKDKDKEIDKDTFKKRKPKKVKYDFFIEKLFKYFEADNILTFKSKINTSIAKKVFDDSIDSEDCASRYADYVSRNKNMAVRLDKFLLAYKEGNIPEIEYANKEAKQTIQPQALNADMYDYIEKLKREGNNG